ncbi:MAG: CPBP family intramembrane metalloprotease [bacterium]|nr:CPBP family intramembrane metalloprotease [bacterium]
MGIFSINNKLRTWLRLLLYIVGAIVITLIAAAALGITLFLTGDYQQLKTMGADLRITPALVYSQLCFAVIASAGLFGLSVLLRRFSDKEKRPSYSLGLDFKRAPLAYLWGFILGILLLSAGYGVQVLLGLVEPGYSGGWFASPVLFIGVFVMFFFSALFEELLMRGYPTKILDEAAPRFFAVAIPSVLFGLMHLTNPGTTWLSTVNITLSGALLGLVYLKSGSLWLAAGLHFGWNFAQGPLFGLGVSGLSGYPTLLKGYPAGHWLWSGGDFGLEGSLIATAVIIVAIVALTVIRRFPLVDFSDYSG